MSVRWVCSAAVDLVVCGRKRQVNSIPCLVWVRTCAVRRLSLVLEQVQVLLIIIVIIIALLSSTGQHVLHSETPRLDGTNVGHNLPGHNPPWFTRGHYSPLG